MVRFPTAAALPQVATRGHVGEADGNPYLDQVSAQIRRVFDDQVPMLVSVVAPIWWGRVLAAFPASTLPPTFPPGLYLHWLGEALKETSYSLHAYALMTHPVHLLFTPKNAATVPQLVISLGRRYVQPAGP